MSARANYFKIGLFVITGVVMLLIAIVALGAGALFRRSVLMETYVNESVQGLDVGSPIKYRGVKVGNVKQIDFASGAYKTSKEYVLIRGTLYPDSFGVNLDQATLKVFEEKIKRGLRVRLAAQGITGQAYLEADYLDPARNPPLPIDWKPDYPYIPSAPSMISRVTQSIESVFQRLENTPIEKVMNDLDRFLLALTQSVEDAHVVEVRRETVGLITDARKTTQRLNQLLDGEDINRVPGDLAGAVASLRETADSMAENLPPAFSNIRSSAADFTTLTLQLRQLAANPEFRQTLANASQIAARLEAASGHFPQTLASAENILRRFDGLTSSRRQDLDALIVNLREITRNLAELTQYSKQYPSLIFFGEPPKPAEAKPR